MQLDYEYKFAQQRAVLSSAHEQALIEVRVARNAQAAAETAAAHARDKLDAAKSQFIDLAVSSSLAEELRRIPIDELSLRNFILLRVQDTVLPVQQALEQARREGQEMRRALQEADSVREAAVAELQIALAGSESRERALARDVSGLERQVEVLQARLGQEQAQVQALVEKGAQNESLRARITELQGSASSLARVQGERDSLVCQVSALRGDVATLTAAVQEASTARRMALEEVEAKALLLATVKRELQELRDAANSALSGSEGEAQSALARLQAEVGRVREERAAGMEEVRQAMREVLDKEVRDARQAKADAQSELLSMRQRLESVTLSHEREGADLRARAAAQGELLAQLRAEVSVKSSELDASRAAVNDLQSQVNRHSSTVDMLRDSLAAARAEVARNAAQAAVLTAQAEGRSKYLAQRLAAYETIEDHLDAAVLASGAAQSGEAGEGEAPSSPDPVLQLLLQEAGEGAGVPTQAARRAAQAVDLARQLSEAQARLKEQSTRMSTLDSLLSASRQEAAQAQALLDAVDGPQEYLVVQIREREREAKEAKQETAVVRAELREARQAVVDLTHRLEEARAQQEAPIRVPTCAPRPGYSSPRTGAEVDAAARQGQAAYSQQEVVAAAYPVPSSCTPAPPSPGTPAPMRSMLGQTGEPQAVASMHRTTRSGQHVSHYADSMTGHVAEVPLAHGLSFVNAPVAMSPAGVGAQYGKDSAHTGGGPGPVSSVGPMVPGGEDPAPPMVVVRPLLRVAGGSPSSMPAWYLHEPSAKGMPGGDAQGTGHSWSIRRPLAYSHVLRS